MIKSDDRIPPSEKKASIGDFRLEYKYEIEYEYDFSNLKLKCILKIITQLTNIVPKTFNSTDQ